MAWQNKIIKQLNKIRLDGLRDTRFTQIVHTYLHAKLFVTLVLHGDLETFYSSRLTDVQ